MPMYVCVFTTVKFLRNPFSTESTWYTIQRTKIATVKLSKHIQVKMYTGSFSDPLSDVRSFFACWPVSGVCRNWPTESSRWVGLRDPHLTRTQCIRGAHTRNWDELQAQLTIHKATASRLYARWLNWWSLQMKIIQTILPISYQSVAEIHLAL